MSRILVLSAALVCGGALHAQNRQGNLQFDMQAIAQALGVTCEYCHSAANGSGLPEPRKDIARQMMAMTRDINARVQTATGKGAKEATTVECATCHRGVAIPRPLNTILRETLAAKGVNAAVEQYRDLRARYFGAATYDFSEGALLALTQPLTSARPDDAIALLNVNLEFYPKSAKTYAAIGYAYTRKYDDATAITMLQKALDLDPGNGVVAGQLEQLKMYQRRK
jgi:tetratricopeptide (TPR) repeat protein